MPKLRRSMLEPLEPRRLLAAGPRQMEYLDRGVVATRASASNVFVSWRSLVTDAAGTGFNVYRSSHGGAAAKLNSLPLTGGTNFTDTTASSASTVYSYSVKPVVGGVEQDPSPAYTLIANAPNNPYYTLPLRNLGAYAIRHINVADLNGDGKYDFVVGRKPINATNEVATAPSLVEAYLHDGTFLWSVNLGSGSYDLDNIEPGPTAVDVGNWDGVIAYDLDLDGKAEVFLRSADGVVFGDGSTLSYPASSDVQFMSALDGLTGAERSRVMIPTDYLSDGPVGAMMAVGYLDGVRPSLVSKFKNRIGSGEFNEMIVAYDFAGGALTQKWKWNNPQPGYNGPFPDSHNIRVVDVDRDGDDEVLQIGYALNGDGTVKYSLAPTITHGDRFHVGDFDPARPGLEGYGVQQNNPSLLAEYFYDAATGQILYTSSATGMTDNGRGDVGDIDPNHPGAEYWSFYGLHNNYNNVHTKVANTQPWPHIQVQWDGDLLSEELSTDHAVIDQWNYAAATPALGRVSTLYNMGSGATTADGFPVWYGDMIGDWREEVIYEKSTRDGLVVFTSNASTTTRLYSLAQNPLYRNDMTTKGYLQSRHTDYFLGGGMAAPPTPNVQVLPQVNDSNAAPTVATPAAASAVTVTGTTVDLSVLGADDGGEGNLKYIWWATGGNGAVAFSANNSNGAKSTTATFTAAGTYKLVATIRDAGGKTVASSVTVTVNQALSGVGVAPAIAPVLINGTRQFTASALDQFGNAMSNSLTYGWLVTGGGGTISSSGLYTAPPTTGTVTVQAQAGSLTGSATVTVTPIVDAYQAEAATAAGGTIFDTNASGYRGTGFANFPGNGGSLTWTGVDGGFGGQGAILFRYALAVGARTGRLTVNGVAESISFPTTGAWNAWATVRVPVPLDAGATNAIRLESTGQDLGNVDEMQVERGTGFNAPPTVATLPAASSDPVVGTSSNLSVLGADDSGEANLTYTWAATGPAAITFSANGTNAAKDTVATFTADGTYTIVTTIRDAAGLTTATSVKVVRVSPPPNPRGWWKLDETGGTNVADASGNGNTGTANGTPSWVSGKSGNALSFDGVDDAVTLPNSIAGTSAGSVAMWIKTGADVADSAMLFYTSSATAGNGGGSENELHLNLLPTKQLQFFIEGGSNDVSLTTASAYADNAWHHVAATWDINGNAVLYVDGASVAAAAHDATSFTGSARTCLGRPAASTRYYSGLMDDVRLYNSALSAGQVQLLFAQGSVPTVFNGTASADTYYLKRGGANVDVWVNAPAAGTGAPTYSLPYAQLSSLSFNGGGGDDVLTIDGSHGNPIPSGGVTFDGGADTDTLAVIGSTGGDAFAFGPISAAVNGGIVTQAAVERRTVAGNGGADAVAVNAGTVALAGPLKASSLTITAGATLDVKAFPLAVDYAGDSPIASLKDQITSGRSGGAWSGTGVVTSSANGGVTTLGIAEASDVLQLSGSQTTLWTGQPVDATTVLVKFTYAGDADLNGKLDGDDYFILDSHAGAAAAAGSSWGWWQGDFDYTGTVNGDDYFLLDSNLGRQGVVM